MAMSYNELYSLMASTCTIMPFTAYEIMAASSVPMSWATSIGEQRFPHQFPVTQVVHAQLRCGFCGSFHDATVPGCVKCGATSQQESPSGVFDW